MLDGCLGHNGCMSRAEATERAECGAPRVAVVIPAYNGADYLAETILSVRRQSLQNWSLLVVDDGSTDRTADVVRAATGEDARIRLVRQENRGVAEARNRGRAESDPDVHYVAFLDQDDLWEPDTLELLVASLESQPAFVAAHGLVRAIDAGGRPIPGDDLADKMGTRRSIEGRRAVSWPVDRPTTFGVLAVECCIPSPGAVLIRRTALERAGGFEPATTPCDDWDLWIRLARLGDFGFVNKVLLNWRRHAGVESGRSKRWRHAYFLVRARMASSPDNTPEQRQLAFASHRLLCRDLVAAARTDAGRGNIREAARHLRRAAYAAYRLLRPVTPPPARSGSS